MVLVLSPIVLELLAVAGLIAAALLLAKNFIPREERIRKPSRIEELSFKLKSTKAEEKPSAGRKFVMKEPVKKETSLKKVRKYESEVLDRWN